MTANASLLSTERPLSSNESEEACSGCAANAVHEASAKRGTSTRGEACRDMDLSQNACKPNSKRGVKYRREALREA